MNNNKYYIGGAVALVTIVMVFFFQRSDWNKDRYILSSDNAGNLTPMSEAYFDAKEKALIAKVDAKLKGVVKRGEEIKIAWAAPVKKHNYRHKCRFPGCTVGGHYLGTPSHFNGDDSARMTYDNDTQRKTGDNMTNAERTNWVIL